MVLWCAARVYHHTGAGTNQAGLGKRLVQDDGPATEPIRTVEKFVVVEAVTKLQGPVSLVVEHRQGMLLDDIQQAQGCDLLDIGDDGRPAARDADRLELPKGARQWVLGLKPCGGTIAVRDGDLRVLELVARQRLSSLELVDAVAP